MRNLSIIFGLITFLFFVQNTQAQEATNYELSTDDKKLITLTNNEAVSVQFELKIEKSQCEQCVTMAKEDIQVRTLGPGEIATWDKKSKDNCSKGKRCITVSVISATKQE